jgi:hypothetical protein
VYDNKGRLKDLIKLSQNGITNKNNEAEKTLNLTHYKPGTYYIRVHNDELVVSQSFIKHE